MVEGRIGGRSLGRPGFDLVHTDGLMEWVLLPITFYSKMKTTSNSHINSQTFMVSHKQVIFIFLCGLNETLILAKLFNYYSLSHFMLSGKHPFQYF